MPKGAKYGGRLAGTPNKATAEIKQAAREHGPKMIALFASIANNPHKPDAIRMQAPKEILDRGYGRPVQPAGGEPDQPITVVIRRFGDDEPLDKVGQMVGQEVNLEDIC